MARRAWKWVFRAAHNRTPFFRECPPQVDRWFTKLYYKGCSWAPLCLHLCNRLIHPGDDLWELRVAHHANLHPCLNLVTLAIRHTATILWMLWLCTRGGGGYLVERWVWGCAAQIGCFFGLSSFPMAPFLFENWFRYRLHFCKMHNFRWIFPFSLPIGCQKVLMHPNLYGKKYWLVLKRVLQEANGFVIGCKFASSLVLL